LIAKEWRDARWRFLVAAVPVVLLVFLIAPYEDVVRMVKGMPGEDPVTIALRDISDLYYFGGLFVLLPLAALLGVASISGEVSNGAIFLLLSRPVSRTRLLLSKWQMRITETILSLLVPWLGVLFVLGTALLVSIIFQTITASIVACALTLFLIFALPVVVAAFYPMNYASQLALRLELYTYWMPTYSYYSDDFYGVGGVALTNFVVCLIAALLPLLVALWLFGRKAFLATGIQKGHKKEGR
jgi:hypothetical protein